MADRVRHAQLGCSNPRLDSASAHRARQVLTWATLEARHASAVRLTLTRCWREASQSRTALATLDTSDLMVVSAVRAFQDPSRLYRDQLRALGVRTVPSRLEVLRSSVPLVLQACLHPLSRMRACSVRQAQQPRLAAAALLNAHAAEIGPAWIVCSTRPPPQAACLQTRHSGGQLHAFWPACG